jgi:NADH:ubiquinone oxidoreductase subunit 4 (subunit M)
VRGESAILGWIVGLPLAGMAAVLMVPARHAARAWLGARAVALAFAVGTLIVAAVAAGRADVGDALLVGTAPAATTPAPTDVARGTLHLQVAGMALAMDGVALPVVLLTAGLGVLAAWGSYGLKRHIKGYFAGLLLGLSGALGALLAVNSLVYLTAVMVAALALFGLLSIRGTDRRVPAARHFLYFVLLAAAAILTALLLDLGGAAFSGAADWSAMGAAVGPVSDATAAAPPSNIAFWFMLAGCGTLAAAVPFHWWLVDTTAESTTPLGFLTAGVFQTLGAYGMLRLWSGWGWWGCASSGQLAAWLGSASSEGVGPDAFRAWAVGVLGAGTMLYGALAALGQENLKRMAAFASVSLGGCILLGLATGTPAGVAGATCLLIGRPVAVNLMVLAAGMIEERLGHCCIPRLGGLAGHLPLFGVWGAPAILGAVGVPAMSVFVGAILVVCGVFQRAGAATGGALPHNSVWLAVAAVLAMTALLACGLWTYGRVFLGTPRPEHSNVARLSLTERWMLAVMGVAGVVLGVWPALLSGAIRAAAGS